MDLSGNETQSGEQRGKQRSKQSKRGKQRGEQRGKQSKRSKRGKQSGKQSKRGKQSKKKSNKPPGDSNGRREKQDGNLDRAALYEFIRTFLALKQDFESSGLPPIGAAEVIEILECRQNKGRLSFIDVACAEVRRLTTFLANKHIENAKAKQPPKCNEWGCQVLCQFGALSGRELTKFALYYNVKCEYYKGGEFSLPGQPEFKGPPCNSGFMKTNRRKFNTAAAEMLGSSCIALYYASKSKPSIDMDEAAAEVVANCSIPLDGGLSGPFDCVNGGGDDHTINCITAGIAPSSLVTEIEDGLSGGTRYVNKGRKIKVTAKEQKSIHDSYQALAMIEIEKSLDNNPWMGSIPLVVCVVLRAFDPKGTFALMKPPQCFSEVCKYLARNDIEGLINFNTGLRSSPTFIADDDLESFASDEDAGCEDVSGESGEDVSGESGEDAGCEDSDDGASSSLVRKSKRQASSEYAKRAKRYDDEDADA